MPQTPNGFTQQIANYAILTPLGMLRRDNYDDFVTEFPDLANLGYITTAESLGALKYTPTRKFKHWIDNDKPLPSFSITAGATGAAGANVTVTLTAASHELGGTKSPVAIGQIWEDDLTGLRYEVITVNTSVAGAHTAVLSPVKQAQATAFTTQSFFKFIGYVNTREASVRNPGIYKGYGETEMGTAIIRTDQTFTDLNAFEHTRLPGGETMMVLSRSEEDERFIASQELQLMFGVQSDNIKTANNENTDSKGFLTQIKDAGSLYAAPTAGVINEDLFRGLKRRISATGLTNEYHALCDVEATIKFDDFMATYGANGSVDYSSFGGSKERAISRNFGSYSIYGMTVHRKEYEYFNSARTHGADINTGINRNMMVVIPQGNVTIDKVQRRHFSVRWMGENEGAPVVRVVKAGALFGQGDEMIGSVGHVTYKGVQALGIRGFSIITI